MLSVVGFVLRFLAWFEDRLSNNIPGLCLDLDALHLDLSLYSLGFEFWFGYAKRMNDFKDSFIIPMVNRCRQLGKASVYQNQLMSQ